MNCLPLDGKKLRSHKLIAMIGIGLGIEVSDFCFEKAKKVNIARKICYTILGLICIWIGLGLLSLDGFLCVWLISNMKF